MLHLHQRLSSPLKITFAEERRTIRYSSQRNTIGHKILKEDHLVEEIPEVIFAHLDEVISAVEREVTTVTATSIAEARAVLEKIEQVITSMNFVCSIPHFLVRSFAEGIEPRELVTNTIYARENDLRRSHIIAHREELFSHVDCDLSSLLYLSIAEILSIPLVMVEVPQHNFIRWRLSEDVHLNWDTNYGFNKYTNNEYARHYDVTSDLIVNGVYLADMSMENVEGYFHFVRGLTFQEKKEYAKAISQYTLGIKKYPKSPSSRNNTAWLFVSIPEAQELISKEEALALALKATELNRTHSYLDTLACVYAEHGNFDKAIEIETEAYQLSQHPSYLQIIEAFREGKTWLDVNG